MSGRRLVELVLGYVGGAVLCLVGGAVIWPEGQVLGVMQVVWALVFLVLYELDERRNCNGGTDGK